MYVRLNDHRYARTPPCSLVNDITLCSQYFHEVYLENLDAGTTYYYQIQASNGTTASDVLSFTASLASGNTTPFSVAVLVDMGYTNALGTYEYLLDAVNGGDVSFVWHGGDLSYADDWYSGILACESSWPVCFDGPDTTLPGGGTLPAQYDVPLPAGEVADQGGPYGGDSSTIYETNWDIWQQWMNNITTKVPYMVLPGNHEASCGEFDGPDNIMTAYLNDNEADSTASKSALTYYSCPVSQRNFTAFQNRFYMPGYEGDGVGNFWYSFDYGLVHFISLDGETDFPYSPEWSFADDVDGKDELPTEAETEITDAGPFGTVNGGIHDNDSYEQYNWLASDLAAIDRSVTPWVIVMSHRPMYSTVSASYQENIQGAFQSLLLEHNVDAYLSGHIHWYERLYPMTSAGAADMDSVVNDNTYMTNPGTSMTHIINGMAGNIESHTVLDSGESQASYTAVLDQENYGFNKLTVYNSTAILFEFIAGDNGSVGDHVWLLKSS